MINTEWLVYLPPLHIGKEGQVGNYVRGRPYFLNFASQISRYVCSTNLKHVMKSVRGGNVAGENDLTSFIHMVCTHDWRLVLKKCKWSNGLKSPPNKTFLKDEIVDSYGWASMIRERFGPKFGESSTYVLWKQRIWKRFWHFFALLRLTLRELGVFFFYHFLPKRCLIKRKSPWMFFNDLKSNDRFKCHVIFIVHKRKLLSTARSSYNWIARLCGL